MMNKEKILEELYESDPSLKLEEEKVEKLVSFLVNHNPDIEAPKAFKTRLGNKLNTIGEFKEIQPKTKRSFMFFMRPLFILVVWVFVLAQFKNYLNIKEVDMRNSPELQNLEILIPNDEAGTSVTPEEEIQLNKVVDRDFEIQDEIIVNEDDEVPAEYSEQDFSDTDIEQEVKQEDDIQTFEDISETNVTEQDITSESIQNTEKSITTEEISQDDSWEEEEYYTCENWKIVIEDSIEQRKIIKSYCDSVWGEIMNGWGNIKYYLCELDSGEEIGLEYIEDKLCE